ncbi:unnamed protein product [Miscanthus lutarioriparius]|uniref:TMEM205-like domain-containing protein n=1 Tax=Miscanthus lutarioriparius TaxID=422564 RepID=A0A811Q8T0_9POAL|nr:unnamed protein product [Miscanthus lutarioriparius]
MGWAARFLTAASFLAAGVLFAPDALPLGGSGAAAAARLVHVLSFATAWGAGLWVTFIGGIVMFKYLPRHQFGSLQGKMFPAYFMLISACSAISVAAFAYLHPWKTASTIERYQLGFLISALGCNLSNLLVFTPMTVEMMMKRHKMEKDLGIGTEVGYSKNAEMAKRNPALAAMNRKFGMIHGLSSLANIMGFGSLALHSWCERLHCINAYAGILKLCHQQGPGRPSPAVAAAADGGAGAGTNAPEEQQRRALPCSPPSPHYHALAALLLLSSPPPPALPLLRLLPPDPPPPLTLLNAAVKALSASSSPDDAFRLLSTLRRLHAPDRLTFLPLLGCASSSLPLLSALHSLLLRLGFLSHHPITLALLKPYPLPHVRALFDDMPQNNKWTVAYNTLITACLKARDIRAARHQFDEMQRHGRSRRSVVSWNLMITGCARRGRDDMAVQCFERMVREGEVAPDDGTLAAVLPACGRTGNVGAGRWAHEYARKTGLLDGTVHVANAVMDMHCKCGDVDSAQEVFMTTRQRSVVSWNAMIAGFSLNGHGVEGIDLFQEMRRHGVEPNAVTFLAVLGCCAHAWAVDIGREIFQSMLSEHGIEPAIEHYGCMVDLFGRSSLLEEAHVLIQGMPMKPNAAIWGSTFKCMSCSCWAWHC